MKVLLLLLTMAASFCYSQIQIDSVHVTDETCAGGSDGVIEVFVSNSTPPVMYSIGGPAQSSNIFTGVACGTYSVMVQDPSGFDQTSVTVQCGASVISTSNYIEPTCSGMCDGMTFISTTGGTPPYTITNPATGMPVTYSSTATLTGMCAGSYTEQVADANGCSAWVTWIVTEPSLITVVTADDSTSGPSVCDGQITANYTGGTPGYTLDWYTCSGTQIGQTSQTATGLCAGEYYVVVTDANGCQEQSACDTVFEPSQGCNMQSFVNTIDVTCYGLCDGYSIIQTTGGQPPYIINDPVTGQPQTYTSAITFGNLCGGTYTSQITDNNGCVETIVWFINEPSPITIVTADDSTSGPSVCDGQITANYTGGTPGYTLDWYTCSGTQIGQTSQTATGLCAGEYYVVVTDANGCQEQSACDTVFEPSQGCNMQSFANTIDVTCYGLCDGYSIIQTTGGQPPYVVNDPTTGQPQTYTSAITFNNLCAGTYTSQITDVNGCVETLVWTIMEPSPIYVFTADDSTTGPGMCDGQISANYTGGTPGYTLDWYTCSGTQIGQTSQTATGLCAGEYYVVVTDANGCQEQSACDTVHDPSVGCNMVSTVQITDATCAGSCDGTMVLYTTGGTPPYMVNDPFVGGMITYTSAYTWTNVCAGTYTFQIQDANGCFETLVATVNEPAPLVAYAAVGQHPSSSTSCDGELVATASGGTVGYYGNWIDCNTGNIVESNSMSADSLCDGDYAIIVTDANGCVDTSDCVNLSGTVGLVDAKQFNVELYPNPATEAAYIVAKGNWELTVISSAGRKLHSESFVDSHVIPVNEIARGIYFIELRNGDRLMTKKLIVQ